MWHAGKYMVVSALPLQRAATVQEGACGSVGRYFIFPREVGDPNFSHEKFLYF